MYSDGDHHDRVGGVDGRAPGVGVVLGVLAQARVVGLVEQRQLELGEVDDLELEAAVLRSPARTNQFATGRPIRPGRVLAMMMRSLGM